MGIVKLLLPRFIYYRTFLPVNRNWKRNTAMCMVQIYTFSYLMYYGMTRSRFRTPLRGVEYVDHKSKFVRSVPIL